MDPDQTPQYAASDQSTPFALNTGIYIKHGYKKQSVTPTIENRLVQRIKVEESTRHKLVKTGLCSARQYLLYCREFFVVFG